MPFKSEAQRKYLWANEPEIARDWTDTYGSGIQAAQGGRIGYQDGTSTELTNLIDNLPFNISYLESLYSNEKDDEVHGQGITGPNKWQQFLSSVTRQPYRAATTGAGGYNVAQLNRMNALGGYYSEPVRQQRRDRRSVATLLARKAAAEAGQGTFSPVAQGKLNQLTMGSRPGHYDRPGGDQTVRGTSSPASPGGWHPGVAAGGIIGAF